MSSSLLTSAPGAPTTISPDGPAPDAGPQSVLLLPADRFFVRTIGLVEDTPVEEQVALAVEGMSPFSPAQLYYGYVVASDRKFALAYAAYRRRFTPDETEAWFEAGHVLPEFLALLALKPRRDGVVLHQGPARITGLAWRSGESLPAAFLAREWPAADQQKFAEELRVRTGLPSDTEITTVQGSLGGLIRDDGEVQLRAGLDAANAAFVLRPEEVDSADVRDREFLLARKQAAKRDNWLWRGVQLVLCLFAVAALVEVSASLLRWQTTKRQARIAAQSADVEHLLTAQGLAQRIGELSERRLMPIEMLALINPGRPKSITFLRVVTRSATEIEIEAQSKTAADVSAYQEVLRALPAIASEQTRINRSSEGLTSFIISLTFKPEVLRSSNGAPAIPPGAQKAEPEKPVSTEPPAPAVAAPAAPETVEVEAATATLAAPAPAAAATPAKAKTTTTRVTLPGLTLPPEPEGEPPGPPPGDEPDGDAPPPPPGGASTSATPKGATAKTDAGQAASQPMKQS